MRNICEAQGTIQKLSKCPNSHAEDPGDVEISHIKNAKRRKCVCSRVKQNPKVEI